MDATRQEVVLEDGLTQEGVALFRTVAVEPFGSSHLGRCLMHGLDDSRTKRLGHVADAEGDDVCLGMHHLEGIHLFGDVSEQIVVL